MSSELKETGLNVTIIPGETPEGCGGNTTEMTEIDSRVQSKSSTLAGTLVGCPTLGPENTIMPNNLSFFIIFNEYNYIFGH